MSKRTTLLIFSLGILLTCASCSVGEDYIRPELALPEDWQQTERRGEGEIFLRSWWKLLKDPVLDKLIERALDANLTRAQAIARIKLARAQRSQVQANWWPQVGTSAGYDRAGRGSRERSESNPILTTGSANDEFQAGFDASWELDIFGKTRRASEAADAAVEGALQDERSVQTSLTAEVAMRYVSFRAYEHRLDVARKNLELQIQSASISERRFSVGFASSLDRAQANAEVANTRAQIPLLEAQLRIEVHALAVLLGTFPAGLNELLAERRALPSPIATLPLGFPKELLDRRPDIRFAEEQVHRSLAELGSAEADWYPQLSLSALLRISGDELSTLGYWDNHIWNLGGSIFYPLIDGGRIRARISAESAELEAARAAYEATVLQALAEVENSLVSFTKERERESSLESAVRENEIALRAAKTLYAEGVADFLNVVSAERALFSSEDALIQNRSSQLTNLIALFKALGGGWSETAGQ